MLTILVREKDINTFEVVDENAPSSFSYGTDSCLRKAILEALDLFDGEENIAMNHYCNKCSVSNCFCKDDDLGCHKTQLHSDRGESSD